MFRSVLLAVKILGMTCPVQVSNVLKFISTCNFQFSFIRIVTICTRRTYWNIFNGCVVQEVVTILFVYRIYTVLGVGF